VWPFFQSRVKIHEARRKLQCIKWWVRRHICSMEMPSVHMF
jgi:hypothetical protein